LNAKVTEVDNETQNNKKSLKLLDAEVKNTQEDVKTLFRLSSEFRKEMDELSEKVAELYVLKKIMAVRFSRCFLAIVLISCCFK
jgi:peptidoglycan hydrolase CwlO-like protein